MKIIVISDDSMLMESIRAGVGEHCAMHTIVGNCYSLKEGLEAADNIRPATILLDYDMYSLNKNEVEIGVLYANYRVIAITTSKRKQKTLIAQGKSAILIEPSNIDALINVLRVTDG